MDRRIYRGRDGYAAEFGHLIVDSSPDAPACTCGAKGCLETFASRVGIERMLKEFLPRYPRTLLKKDSTPRDVYGLAVKGDPAAKAVVKEVGERLGAGLASLVNVFNPDAVLLGGGIVSAGKIFFDSFRPAYERLVLPFYRHRTVKFVRPRFGSEGGLVGAASLILQDVVLKNETEPRPGRTISESRKTKTKG
jgi:predicted NBD/HSP70 family sugar kinase